ncbi:MULTISPECIES: hypothetical protein [Bacillus]|uniref:hypothetical protein n=1 Tax=Bacillus TaxID=1386 RepID=UPI000BB8E9A3|nr:MULTISPECIES: hypothetical protein [Bacillus]
MIYSTEQIVKMDAVFKEERYKSNQGDFHIIIGKIPVLVSAPHSVTQTREGQPKTGEFRTGVIAQLLQESTNCFTIFKTRNKQDDANYDPVSTYREIAKKLICDENIQYVLDLHIMAPHRPYDIDLGTGRGKNIQGRTDLIRRIEDVFHKNGVKEVRVDNIFTAGFPYTVSADIAKSCNVFCLQIEMNWQLLEGMHSFSTIVQSLEEVILFLTKGVTK